MLQEITDARDKERAQKALQAALTDGLAPEGERAIGFRGGGSMNPVWSNGEGQLYYAYGEPHPGQATRLHWNSFGYFASAGQLRIVAEINIPTETEQKRAEGFFARDPASGATLLMHSGSFGGGVKGLTQSAFYAWNGDDPTVVAGATPSIPQLFDTTLSPDTPEASTASISPSGTPHRPNPPTHSVMPSHSTSASAAAACLNTNAIRPPSGLRTPRQALARTAERSLPDIEPDGLPSIAPAGRTSTKNTSRRRLRSKGGGASSRDDAPRGFLLSPPTGTPRSSGLGARVPSREPRRAAGLLAGMARRVVAGLDRLRP